MKQISLIETPFVEQPRNVLPPIKVAETRMCTLDGVENRAQFIEEFLDALEACYQTGDKGPLERVLNYRDTEAQRK